MKKFIKIPEAEAQSSGLTKNSNSALPQPHLILMSQLVLSRGVSRKNILKGLIPNIEFGPYFLLFSLIVFVSLITVVTLMFSARQVTKGYVLNSLEAQHQALIRESERKDMEVSQVRSLKFIEESSKARSMVSPGQIVYMHGEATIASK